MHVQPSLSGSLTVEYRIISSIFFTAVGLSIQGNELQGSLNALCDVRDERRQEYAEYLTILDADCEGTSPAVECSCCMCF